jgi:hypothetical protein
MKPRGTLAAISILGLLTYIAGCTDSPGKKEVSPPELEKLIRQLGSHNFGEREAAERKLGAVGKPALSYLRKAAMDQTDPELRRRIQGLIDRLGGDRREFAELLSTIEKGMKKAEVARILGNPDDIRRWAAPQDRDQVVWCYGTSGHNSFPTLGEIFFDAHGRVSGTCGGQGTPPPPSLIDEGELRKLLTLMAHGEDSNRWDPAWSIKVVNELQALGKRKALATIEEFGRVLPFYQCPDEVILVLLILFDVPKDTGYMPAPPAGMAPPKERKRIPRFPILILGDVPLNLCSGHAFFGGTGSDKEDLLRQIAFFRDHGEIRAKPLQPTDKPLQIYSEWESYRWPEAERPGRGRTIYFDENARRADSADNGIKLQLQTLVKTVYLGDVEHGSIQQPIRWDMKRNMYTFLDGKILPQTPSEGSGKPGGWFAE